MIKEVLLKLTHLEQVAKKKIKQVSKINDSLKTDNENLKIEISQRPSQREWRELQVIHTHMYLYIGYIYI